MTDPTPPTLASLSLTDEASTPTPEEKPENSAEESKSTASPPSGTSVGTQSPSTSPLQRPQPAQTNDKAPGTSSPAGRPQPLHVAASAPTIPSTNTVRPQPGARPGVARGMPAPMGMRAQAGRGAGGPHMQTKMLPSLQAKMDKVCISPSFCLLHNRRGAVLTNHTTAFLRLPRPAKAHLRLQACMIRMPHLWAPSCALKLSERPVHLNKFLLALDRLQVRSVSPLDAQLLEVLRDRTWV